MDWVKIEKGTPDKPEVIAIAEAVRLSPDVVFAKLFRLWAWADTNLADGQAAGVSAKWVDNFVGRKGFSKAMADVGWLTIDGGSVTFPSFDRHMGKSAKKRALNGKWMSTNRDPGGQGSTTNQEPGSGDSGTTTDKKSGDENTTKHPLEGELELEFNSPLNAGDPVAGKTTAPKPNDSLDDFSTLNTDWRFHYRGVQSIKCQDARAYLAELLKAFTPSEIRAAIAGDRDKTEPPWDFKKRLLAEKAEKNGTAPNRARGFSKPATTPRIPGPSDEQLAADRAKAERDQAELEARLSALPPTSA